MAKLEWNAVGEQFYTVGADRGVFYPAIGPGVPWNGIVSVKESPSDTGIRITFMDGQKIQTQLDLGNFTAQISAITYPFEFEEYDGSSDIEENWSDQPRKLFNFTYRTFIGNKEKGIDLGYQIHLVYNALAEPTIRDYTAFSGKPDPALFDWRLSTMPVLMPGFRPASHLIIDSRVAYPIALSQIEDILYGSSMGDPRFPTMQEVFDVFESHAIFKVTDHGDGTATISGPDDAVFMIDPDTARFIWPSVIQVSPDTYRLTSL